MSESKHTKSDLEAWWELQGNALLERIVSEIPKAIDTGESNTNKRKIIQLCSHDNVLLALCNDGTVLYAGKDGKWVVDRDPVPQD